MKKYMIEVLLKFESNPTDDEFKNICDKMISAVDKMCNNEICFHHVTVPTKKEINEHQFRYRIYICFNSEEEPHSSTIFELLNSIHPLTLVTLQERRFCKRAGTEIYWFHEGETTYWDGGTYISPNYDLYVNGRSDYTVQYVPVATKNMYERDKQRYNGVTYMWRCTGCWDNFMEARTLDEALKEFEEYYYNQLWRSIESSREKLAEAEDRFKEFNEYRWRTR